jgi:hypothetical protein
MRSTLNWLRLAALIQANPLQIMTLCTFMYNHNLQFHVLGTLRSLFYVA